MLVESSGCGGRYRPKAKARNQHVHNEERWNMLFNLSVLVRVDTNFGAMLVYFPLLRDGIVLSAHEKLDAPDYKRKEDVHPPPPHL
jgi:hypothetical protein